MLKQIFYVLLIIVSATTTHCSKTSTNPDDTLPPETQTGAGTFACKINGVVWKYKNANYEFLSTKPATRWEFDPTYNNGNLSIVGGRYLDGVNETDMLILGADSLMTFKERNVNNIKNYHQYGLDYMVYDTKLGLCGRYNTGSFLDTTPNFYCSGKLSITRLDQSARIISGTFYATIKQTSCDTLKITDGRFDLKF